MAGQKKRGKHEDWLTEEGLLKIEGWARDGLIDEEIAHNMGIARSTLARWKNQYEDIGDALKRGKEVVDRIVENELFRNATGYYYEEETTDTYENADGVITGRATKKVKKWKAADTGAQAFWLKNRKPDVWRDRKETKITGDLDISKRAIDIEKYLTEDTGEGS